MNEKNGLYAPLGSVCPKKVSDLSFVIEPKVARTLCGQFLSGDSTERELRAICLAGADLEARLVDSLDEFELTRIRFKAHGQALRTFLDHRGLEHE